MDVFAVEHHETDEVVYCWGKTMANRVVKACMRAHPDERFTIVRVDMTEEEYDALPNYEGDCE